VLPDTRKTPMTKTLTFAFLTAMLLVTAFYMAQIVVGL
jgi:hypothetical protein